MSLRAWTLNELVAVESAGAEDLGIGGQPGEVSDVVRVCQVDADVLVALVDRVPHKAVPRGVAVPVGVASQLEKKKVSDRWPEVGIYKRKIFRKK